MLGVSGNIAETAAAKVSTATPLQLLRVNAAGTALEWFTPPACRVYGSIGVTVPTATDTAIAFNTERYDVGSIHSTVTNTSRLTAPIAGVYHVEGNIRITSAAAATVLLSIRLNGTTVIAQTAWKTATGIDNGMIVSCDYALAASDYVEIVVRHNEGSDLSTGGNANWADEASMRWTGPST